MRHFGERSVLQGAPIDVAPEDNPTSEPEPDLVVLNRDLSHFKSDRPAPKDLRLVIEVADTSLGFDRTTKAALYARAGIVEYWILDIEGRRMIVHRDPQAGQYTSIAAYSFDESVAPLASPESLLSVAEAFLDWPRHFASVTVRPVRTDSRAASRISTTTTLFSSEFKPEGFSLPRTTAVR